MKKIILLLLTIIPSNAFSYHVNTHTLITKAAISLMADKGVSNFESDLLKGTKNADYNLLYKWFYANHFFLPQAEYNAKMKGLIRGTLDRYFIEKNKYNPVTILSKFDKNDESKSWNKVGYVLHFIQDMAAPSHSMGIMHAALDSFENYKFEEKDFLNYVNAHKNILNLYLNSLEEERASPYETLVWLAMMTQYQVGKSKLTSTLWQILNRGELGDRFGDLKLAPKEVWDSFYFMQMSLSVIASVRALHYFKTNLN